MDAILRSMHALTVLLVEEVLHMEHGYMSSIVTSQCTAAVFFPLHMASARAWWHLVHLSFPQSLRASFIEKRLAAEHSSWLAPAKRAVKESEVWCFRCFFLWSDDPESR